MWHKYVLFLFMLASCSNNHQDNKLKLSSEEADSKIYVDSIALVTFEKFCTVKWNNQTSQFLEDSSFALLESQIEHNSTEFIDIITDLTETDAVACPYNQPLRTGDLAFIALNKLRNLPLFEIFETQLDVKYDDCCYSYGIFELLQKNRESVQRNTRAFFSSHPSM